MIYTITFMTTHKEASKKEVKLWLEKNVVLEPDKKEYMESLYKNYQADKINGKIGYEVMLRPKTFATLVKSSYEKEVIMGKIRFVYPVKSTILGISLIKTDKDI